MLKTRKLKTEKRSEISWLATQSRANRSLPKFPTNREKYREIYKNRLVASRLVASIDIGEMSREFGHFRLDSLHNGTGIFGEKTGNKFSEQGIFSDHMTP